MGKPKRKKPAKKVAPAVVAKELAVALDALRKVAVPDSLIPYKERAMNSVIGLNDRINGEAGKVKKAAEREAKKAERKKAKAVREAGKVERKKAKAAKLQERIAALQAQVKELD